MFCKVAGLVMKKFVLKFNCVIRIFKGRLFINCCSS